MLELTRMLVADMESGAYSQSGALGTALEGLDPLDILR
jgi:hypothetical protein